MTDLNSKIREYDKRIGVPEFKGWQKREIEAIKKAQYEQLRIASVGKTK